MFTKILLLLSNLVLIANVLLGQTIDYNRIILPSNTANVGIEEKLVQLAWNNHPANRIEENNYLIAQRAVKVQSAEWLDIIRLQGNLNEFTINPESAPANRNNFYPRYNFSATINLGMFVSVPARTKISKLEVANQEERINARKLELRSEVLRRYELYKLNREVVKIQTSFTDDAYSNFLIAEQQFKNGNITMEAYNQSLQMYDTQLVNKLQKETEYEIAKIELEELIGVRIEEIIND